MADITRRSFLEHTLYTAAAGLAAVRIAQGADKEHDADPATQPSGRTSSEEKIGVAVIGLHGRGLSHIDAYTYDDRVEVVALCDVDESQFIAAQQKLKERGRPVARTYQDIRKLLEDKDVQAVSIATPNHWHALAGIWAMQAGKDAYVEKPVSHEVTEGRRLEQARVKYNKICQAGLQSRSSRATQDAIKYVHDGHIGTVQLSRGLCYKRRESIGHFDDSAVPAGLDYNIWLGPAPVRPFNQNRFLYNWHWWWDYGNGDIGNQGVHQMDIARWALKKDLPTSAVGLGGRFGYEDDGQTPNTLLALYNYDDSKLIFEVRGLQTPPHEGVDIGNIIYGTEGFVAVTADYGTAAAFDNHGKLIKKFRGGGSHFNNFISAVKSRNQSDLNCPILEGHYSAALCHLGNISYRLGKPQSFMSRPKVVTEDVDLTETYGRYTQHLENNKLNIAQMSYDLGPKLAFDPQAENFGANSRANEMLTREYRAPFIVPESL